MFRNIFRYYRSKFLPTIVNNCPFVATNNSLNNFHSFQLQKQTIVSRNRERAKKIEAEIKLRSMNIYKTPSTNNNNNSKNSGFLYNFFSSSINNWFRHAYCIRSWRQMSVPSNAPKTEKKPQGVHRSGISISMIKFSALF